MSALSVMGTGAAKAVGTVLAAGLLAAACVAPAYAVGVEELGPLKVRPGGAHGALPTRLVKKLPVLVVVRLPDGRLLRFTALPSASGSAPTSGAPSSGTPGSGTPSGSPGSGSPSGDPSASGLPVPVVSSLFPSPSASGSHSRRPSSSGRPSRATPSAAASAAASAAVTQPASVAPVQDVQGGDAVPPAAVPDRPASSVPPPLGPQAVLHPDSLGDQIAAPRTAPTGAFAHRGRLLGVGLALIGTGAALFGWRIRRL